MNNSNYRSVKLSKYYTIYKMYNGSQLKILCNFFSCNKKIPSLTTIIVLHGLKWFLAGLLYF